MKKRLLLFVMNVVYILPIAAQTAIPYNPRPVHVIVPLNISGIEKDSTHRVGDHLEYDVTGQEIKDTILYQLQPLATSDRSTPWLTLEELYGAYQNGDMKKIKSLFTKGSQSRLNDIFSTKEAQDNFLAKAKGKTAMRPYFGMVYDNGFIVLWETAPGHIERIFLQPVDGKWMIAIYEEKNNPMVNNVMDYYTNKPLPAVSPEITQRVPDTLTTAEQPFITFKLKRANDWVSVFIPKLGIATSLTAQDNGFNDNDDNFGVIKMIFYTDKFQPGDYELEAVETNYPIMSVNSEMIQGGTKFHVNIKAQ